MPERIQRKRAKGWRMPPNAVYVGRPSKWGNPFRVVRAAATRGGPLNMWAVVRETAISDGAVADVRLVRHDDRRAAITDAVERYRLSWRDVPVTARGVILAELAGRDLACWCPLDHPCHADVLLEIANEAGDS